MSRREGTDMIVLVVEDCTGRKLLKMKAQASDERMIESIFNSVINKYGMGLKIIRAEAPAIIEEEEKFEW